ncbi:SPFH domain-containing protein [Geomesophilobacter sediminis]|uniref:SPFH domain-containing protein n=1 Tax=Geomesophilobacter sediminis TaxID=2798584 RepID=A0A8J7JG53_9BACT|nr:SPFH domain-containing protein [Geomesophilobacter sediminis]MBJ6725529.1 SPFH domain-containing protein [Geomesophilobacter sediminis]
MSLWEKAVAELVDVIEWTDDSSDTLVWKFPRYADEIKYGAQLIVRPAQAAVFVNRGTIADVFAPGQHTLSTANLPVLTTLQGWKYGFQSPFKAEVYFVSTRNFTNLKWGTKNPVMVRDPEFGPVRLRSFGTYVVRIADPATFIREIAGTNPHFRVEEVSEQLKNLIVTRFSDMLGESKIPLLDLAANYNDLSAFLTAKIAPEFLEYGIEVTKILVENIALPQEVEAALDKKTSMGIIGNLDNFLKFQSANAVEAAAKNPGGAAAAGIGMGMGFAMASQLGKLAEPAPAAAPADPPELPERAVRYFVGKDGKKAGPFDLEAVLGYIRKGAITRETLMWKHGMAEWQNAASFTEFTLEFGAAPPPLPKQ